MDEYQIINTVANSYDEIAPQYEKYFRSSGIANKFNDLLARFVSFLPKGAKILDAGVGSGIPTSRFLIDNSMNVVGVDISDTMLKMASRNVPEAELHKIDISKLDYIFENETFDGIISVFTLFHIPRKIHGYIFKIFASLLKKNGILMINTGTTESDGFSDFFGNPMYWSNYRPEKTLELVKNTGLHVIFEDSLIRGGEKQYWICAQKK